MNKIILAAALSVVVFFSSAASAACPEYHIFRVEIWTGSTYQFYSNFLDANALLSAIEANSSVTGRVRSTDACTDNISTWTFSNGVVTLVR